jgi:hypothetical protein
LFGRAVLEIFDQISNELIVRALPLHAYFSILTIKHLLLMTRTGLDLNGCCVNDDSILFRIDVPDSIVVLII